MDRKQKTLFQLDTPYTEVQWPVLSSKSQEHIFEVLIRLLAPLGNHRATYATPSKGKRKARRNRKEIKRNEGNMQFSASNASPPLPEISSHLLVGLASITRQLEENSKSGVADGFHENGGTGNSFTNSESGMGTENYGKCQFRHLRAIFVCRSSLPSVLHAHLPQLVATASLRHPQFQPTRLVQLPLGSEKRLCSALSLPRVSSVAILEDAPHSKHLLDLIQGLVPVIEVSWLEEARKAQYLPVKINTILTTVPMEKKKSDKR